MSKKIASCVDCSAAIYQGATRCRPCDLVHVRRNPDRDGKAKPGRGKRWAEADIEKLREAVAAGMKRGDIAKLLGRSRIAIVAAAHCYCPRPSDEKPDRDGLYPLERLVYDQLFAAADAGKSCPTGKALGALIDRSEETASNIIRRLESLGMIEIRAGFSFRAIRIVATGAKTRRFDRLEAAPVAAPVAPAVVIPLPTPVFRDPCPGCGVRLDADPALCCARGRALRRLVA